MPTLTMTKGLPGSGKTSWANHQAELGGNVVVCKDDLRNMLHAGKWSQGNEKAVIAARDALVVALLVRGLNPIVADTNLAPSHEKRLRQIADDYNATFQVKDFTDVPLDECIKRDAARAHPVGERVIRKMWVDHLKPEPQIANIDTRLPPAIVVDMDGTLSINNGHRSFCDESKAHLDGVNEPVYALVMSYVRQNPETNLIIMSGRDFDRGYEATVTWLKANDVPFDLLLMRPGGDQRKDAVVKRELFEQYVQGHYSVSLWIDDREQVVRMVRDELDLPCMAVADGWF